MQLDAVIFGGGAAGLWLLDEFTRRGSAVLLIEANALGHGQTVASQGIIHGGLKYTLTGLLTPAAKQIREMPNVWRSCLAGETAPDLSRTRVRSQFCHLWRTDSISSRLGMIGASIGLRVAPRPLDETDRPQILAGCPGTVSRLDEQVISPTSFVTDLATQHRQRIVRLDVARDVEFEVPAAGQVHRLRIRNPLTAESRTLSPRYVIFTAGSGNAELRTRVGLTTPVMQRRPLHMVMLRGDLPQFHGHCVDGAKTRVTITSDFDEAGNTVWQVGGQIAEAGVAWDRSRLVAQARSELQTVLPALDLRRVEWGTYRVDRAEGRTASGTRPDTIQILRDGNTITAWPTKLALAPMLAREAAEMVGEHATQSSRDFGPSAWHDWPRPAVAVPPWDVDSNWQPQVEFKSRAA
ncbi:MAG: FAD-dependent oxidoreductase [Planctomycetales bacterium]|nr:FAD-dependent oxidoreductase [Planctomycetales bacterium]